jgi:formylmethanofuran:tetrahydromethanopterin formyltransferase
MKRRCERVAVTAVCRGALASSAPYATALAAALMMLAASGCNRPLPEQNTPAAQLYASRCGQCHRAYDPGSMSAAMWQVQVEIMADKMRQYRVPPLTNQERGTILDYLTRNAAHD